jgi:hypothetical protein
MRRASLAFLATGLFTVALLGPASSQGGDADAMAEMMKKAAKYTQPGEHHELLERLVGEWDTEIALVMGGQRTPAEKGRASGSWLMDGRWVQMRGEGSMMGRPLDSYLLFGYDNFKQSYVSTAVSSMDTAMLRSEGDVDPHTGALILYGTLDEYLTGEHDKMVKYVWRFPDEDTIVHEVHDLPIGESGTQVVEIRFRRR